MMEKKDKIGQKKKLRLRIQTGIFLAAAIFLAVGAAYLILFYNRDAYKRQETEESLAEAFIDYLAEHAPEIEKGEAKTAYTPDYFVRETGTAVESACPESISEAKETAGAHMAADGVIYMENTFTDNSYYVRNGITFTPDYAEGYLVCVLEYPDVGIRRGVYSGTWDDIYADLDMWMVTFAHPDMQLGQTHLAIYGHNHTAQNLSFNNLSKAKVGDRFYLYGLSGIYTYEVTSIFSDWRTDTTSRYVDNFAIGSDICYIITCGRDNFLINNSGTRYKDFIVEGHVISHQPLSEYAKERLTEEEAWQVNAVPEP